MKRTFWLNKEDCEKLQKEREMNCENLDSIVGTCFDCGKAIYFNEDHVKFHKDIYHKKCFTKVDEKKKREYCDDDGHDPYDPTGW